MEQNETFGKCNYVNLEIVVVGPLKKKFYKKK